MGGMSIGNLPSQSILKKINDIAADVNDLDLEGVNNLKSKLSNLVAPELGNSDEKAISQKVVTENIQRLNTEVNNKINKVESAQNGNLPTFDNGNVKDSKIPSDNIAQQNGYYEGMVVGASRSLAGDNEVRAEYVFRPSGGTMDIGSGTASINRVLGKTLVWNQLVQNGNFTDGTNKWYYGTLAFEDNGDYITLISSTDVYEAKNLSQKINVTAGHKLYLRCQIKGSCTIYFNSSQEVVNVSNKEFKKVQVIKTSDGYEYMRVYLARDPNNSSLLKSTEFSIKKNIQLFDLTQMFGEGNEPTTVEEFEAMFPNDYYEYNEGALISNDAVGIKSVGFNAWDEEWELGTIATANGELTPNSSMIRSKNFIEVIPNTQYSYYYVGSFVNNRYIYQYDESYKFIKAEHGNSLSNCIKFTTLSNCRYIKFVEQSTTTYNNNICINLSHSGIRDGDYEPYEEHKLLFNKGNKLSSIKGKLNGEGESVVIFPDGLRSAGNVRDEIVGNVAIKRIGAVDMGTLTWTLSSVSSFYSSKIPLPSVRGYNKKQNIIHTTKYVHYTSFDNGTQQTIDNVLSINAWTGTDVVIYDTSYTDTTTFKQSLQGQILYYELAEPETYILDEAIPMNYVVDDWGTEQRLVADENEVLAPLCYDVTYAINAVDTIRNMPKNYISEETMQAFLSAVGSAMGGTWSMTWNEDMQKYVFTFAPNAVATDVE